MSPECFQHSFQRTSTHKTSPENYRNTFKTTTGGKKIKTAQSAISSEQKTQLLTPEQQTQRIIAAMLPADFIHNYTVPLSSSSSLPLVSKSILHGTVARAPLSSRASVHSLQHPCTLQASGESETRCYTTLLPLSSPHSASSWS